MRRIYYLSWRLLFICVIRVLFPYTVIGRENIPEQGPVLLCANHISLVDPPAVAMQTRREVHFMAKQELFSIPIVSMVIRSLNAFPVKRGGQDRSALKRAMQVLDARKALLIFPEGTRLRTGNVRRLGKGHSGAGYIALKKPCTIIPVCVVGPYKLFRRIKIVIGQPVDLDHLRQEQMSMKVAQQASDRIVSAIQQLMDQHAGDAGK